MSTSITAGITATVSAAVHAHIAAAAIHPATDTALSRAVCAALILILLLDRAVSAHLQFVRGDVVFQCAPSRSLPTRCLKCKSTYVHALRFQWIKEITYRYVESVEQLKDDKVLKLEKGRTRTTTRNRTRVRIPMRVEVNMEIEKK